MKMRKLLTLAFNITMAASVLAGCGGDTASADSSGSGLGVTVPNSKMENANPAGPNEGTMENVNPTEYIAEPVDMGLSVKWASFNVGASKPEEYGGLMDLQRVV